MNNRTLAAALLAATAPAFAAPQAVAAPQADKAYHLYIPGRHIAPPAQSATPTMLYFGGPVLAKARVVAVFWSLQVAASTKSQIGPYLQAITHSTYVDQLAQYSTHITGVNGHKGTNQTIVRGTYAGKYTITPQNTAKSLTDTQVQTELLAQIAAGALPKANLNTLYVIYFPADITITLGGATSCVGFGAYHFATSATVSRSNVFYAVMPDCGGGFAEQTVVTSHEFAEATTDAIPTPGSNPAYPQAWNDANGNEIGDLCEGHDTTLTSAKKTYTVQEIFTNSTNACATGKFTSP
jgi:hypothetical protein